MEVGEGEDPDPENGTGVLHRFHGFHRWNGIRCISGSGRMSHPQGVSCVLLNREWVESRDLDFYGAGVTRRAVCVAVIAGS